MTLNIGGSGSFRDIIKYNAKEGRWYLRANDEETEIESPTMVMDLANIATGWMLFLEGQAPNRVMDPALGTDAPKPSEAHKRGFMELVYSTKHLNGVAEFSSCSFHLGNAIKDLHGDYLNQRDQHPGMLPVVRCRETTAIKGKFGTNHKPTFEIVDWADRPEDLPDESPSDPADVWKGGNFAAQPATRPASEPNKADTASVQDKKAEALF